MMHAPEMSPTLDDALRALDGASVNGVINATQLAAVRGFLEQLDNVRDVAPVLVNGRALAEHLEGAYLAGVRCADESGHVLVMSLPAFLQVCPPPVPGPRAAWRDRLARWFGPRVSPVMPVPAARPAPIPPASGCAYPECFCSFEKMVAGCQTRPAK